MCGLLFQLCSCTSARRRKTEEATGIASVRNGPFNGALTDYWSTVQWIKHYRVEPTTYLAFAPHSIAYPDDDGSRKNVIVSTWGAPAERRGHSFHFQAKTVTSGPSHPPSLFLEASLLRLRHCGPWATNSRLVEVRSTAEAPLCSVFESVLVSAQLRFGGGPLLSRSCTAQYK